MAIGPDGRPNPTARRVIAFGLVPALAGAAIQWGQEELGDNFALNQWIDPALPALAHLAEVDAFWLMPLLVPGLAWSVLPGWRGTAASWPSGSGSRSPLAARGWFPTCSTWRCSPAGAVLRCAARCTNRGLACDPGHAPSA